MKYFLKRLKDSLYMFLVEGNGAVASLYHGYVDSDLERHRKHRIKSWMFLIKLNLKYRVFRFNPVNPNKRAPYDDGSESAVNYRIIPIRLAHMAMKYDVISFDMFDTLILRPFDDSKSVFTVAGEKLKYLNFKNMRTNAEIQAKERNFRDTGSYEADIYDIYEELNRITNIDKDEGIKTELETELSLCYGNPYMLDVFNMLKEQGKRIIITSDMYWRSEHLDALLKKCGYEGYSRIYVSCEHNAGKSEGKLFKIIKSELGENLSYLHIGDNYIADIEGAKAAGIDSFFYKGVNAAGGKYRASGISPLYSSAYAGIVNAHLHKDSNVYSPQYEFGFIYGGFYILGFMSHIHRYCKTHNIDKVLFIARDGDIYRKVFNMLPRNDIPSGYLLWSRTVNIIYFADKDKDFFLQRVCRGQRNLDRTLGDILESFDMLHLIPKLQLFCVNKKEADNRGGKIKYEYLGKDAILDDSNVLAFEDFLIEHFDSIVSSYKETRKELEEYLLYMAKGAKRLLLVDVGWAGTAPMNIKNMLENILDIKCLIMLGAVHKYSFTNSCGNYDYMSCFLFDKNHNRSCYNMHSRSHIDIFEMFTQAETPSFLRFRKNDKEYSSFVFQSPDVENYSATREIQQGIIDFAKLYIKHFGHLPYMMNISGQDSYMPFMFSISNKNIALNAVGDCKQQSFTAGSSHNPITHRTIAKILDSEG